MKRLTALLLAAGLAACSFAPITVAVPDIVLPGNDSLGLVCYAEASEQAPVRFGRATYSATASYRSSVPGNEVTVQVFGRATPPENPCVGPSAADRVLSDPFRLRAGESRTIEVGGAVYGGALAELISSERYWLGATVAGGVLASTEERITLTDGVIQVSY